MRWTSEQRSRHRARRQPNRLRRGGRGKTAVLTERIVSRIRAGAPSKACWCTPLRRAAAAEMKGRNRKAPQRTWRTKRARGRDALSAPVRRAAWTGRLSPPSMRYAPA